MIAFFFMQDGFYFYEYFTFRARDASFLGCVLAQSATPARMVSPIFRYRWLCQVICCMMPPQEHGSLPNGMNVINPATYARKMDISTSVARKALVLKRSMTSPMDTRISVNGTPTASTGATFPTPLQRECGSVL